jgi:hypothetical protein
VPPLYYPIDPPEFSGAASSKAFSEFDRLSIVCRVKMDDALGLPTFMLGEDQSETHGPVLKKARDASRKPFSCLASAF